MRMNQSKKKDDGKKVGFFEGIAMKVVDNLQIFLDNIHVRYEDNINNISFGITVDNINMRSVDVNWKAGIIEIGQKIMRKMLEVRNLGIYLNPGENFIRYTNLDEFNANMAHLIFKDNNRVDENNYIISPMSGVLKLDVNTVDKDYTRPKVKVNFLIEDTNIEFDAVQYKKLLSTLDFFLMLIYRTINF